MEARHWSNVYFRNVLSVILLIKIIIPLAVTSSFRECPGLPTRKGISLECVSTKLGAAKFNCSRPMPIATVAYFSCQPYYKEINSSPFDVKSIRCNSQGQWTKLDFFLSFKCEYECGKALPTTKTSVVRGQLKTRTTWSWHALIYVKLNWAKVLEASYHRRSMLTSSVNKSTTAKKRSTTGLENDYEYVEGNVEDEEFSTERSRNSIRIDPVKLAEIFDNKDLSIEEMFDPRYRYIFVCMGTLISDNFILTAGHCLTDLTGRVRTPKDFMIVLGGTTNSFYSNVNEPQTQIIPVGRIHISDHFIYDEFKSDIAIIQLQYSAVLNNAVLPACLPENGDDAQSFIVNKKSGEAIGSMINIYKEGVSNELKSKKLQVLPNIECVRNIERIPSDKEFCAGNLGVNICSGDSGSGLISTPNFGLRRRYTIQGIISYGRAGKICEHYAVFTKVYKFIDFIKGIMHDDKTET